MPRLWFMTVLLALVIACSSSGGDGDEPEASATAEVTVEATSTPAPTETPEPEPEFSGVITTVYDTPGNEVEQIAAEVLQVGGTEGIAEGMTSSFVLPVDLTIYLDSGDEGPYYDSGERAIHYSYGFVDYEASVFRSEFPDISDFDLGARLAALNNFILMHEMGHALIDIFDLPVLGPEEDAADALATLFMTEFIDGGEDFAYNAAQFFQILDANQLERDESAYWDEHSLDIQRAYNIICWIAGSSEESYDLVAQGELIGEDRLVRCPAEYQRQVDGWFALLRPYARPGSNFATSETVEIDLLDSSFDPEDVSASINDSLLLTNVGKLPHNFTIEGSGVDVDLEPGESILLEGPAPVEPGEYVLFCRFHRAIGMETTIVVEE